MTRTTQPGRLLEFCKRKEQQTNTRYCGITPGKEFGRRSTESETEGGEQLLPREALTYIDCSIKREVPFTCVVDHAFGRGQRTRSSSDVAEDRWLCAGR